MLASSSSPSPPREIGVVLTYVGNDRVTIVTRHEVLHRSRGSILESVPADEVVGELVLRGV
jgi:hypothetical protein